MNFSLFLVFEGSSETGPVPLCRVVDPGLTHQVAEFALAKASRSADALGFVDRDAAFYATCEADRLRVILAMI